MVLRPSWRKKGEHGLNQTNCQFNGLKTILAQKGRAWSKSNKLQFFSKTHGTTSVQKPEN